MIQLFLRFSRRQQLVMGLFILLAVVGSVLAFLVDHAILIVALFWMLCAAVFVMLMYHRRLNAKITRTARAARMGSSAVAGRGGTRPVTGRRISTQESLDSLQSAFARRRTVAAGLPLARKLIQERGDLSGAREVLDQLRGKSGLTHSEENFVRRVDSLNRLLEADYPLPHVTAPAITSPCEAGCSTPWACHPCL